jgi:gluconokinase
MPCLRFRKLLGYENEPEKFENTFRFVSLKEYVIYQLTGEFYIDYSLASATGLVNLLDLNWDKEALKFAQLDASYFSFRIKTKKALIKIAQATSKHAANYWKL